MDRRLALLVLIFVNVLWGSAYAVTKVALLELPPTLLGAFRVTLSAILLWLIQFWLAKPKRSALHKTGFAYMPTIDKVRIGSLGMLGVGLAYIIDYFGLNLTTATDASLMIIGEVTFTSLLAYWWANESISQWKMSGIALGAVGVTILVLGHVTENQATAHAGIVRVIGDLLILGALLCQAVYTVLGTHLARKYQPFTLLTYAYTGSLVIWLPIIGWHWATGQMPVTISSTAWFGVFYLAAISSLFCYFIWFSVSSRIGAGASAISLFAQPVVGALVGLTWLHEPLTASLVVSALLIFVALYLTTVAPDGDTR
ncbi:MAG: DMT family transporter [Caldilineaceae bacterium]